MGQSKSEWKKIPIRLSLIHLIDIAIEKGPYRSRAEFVADAIRRRLEDLGIRPPRRKEAINAVGGG